MDFVRKLSFLLSEHIEFSDDFIISNLHDYCDDFIISNILDYCDDFYEIECSGLLWRHKGDNPVDALSQQGV